MLSFYSDNYVRHPERRFAENYIAPVSHGDLGQRGEPYRLSMSASSGISVNTVEVSTTRTQLQIKGVDERGNNSKYKRILKREGKIV